MPTVAVNGIELSYERTGSGEPVLLINPAASRARIWHTYQVPALTRAGFQVVTFDGRGSAPSSTPPGPYRLAELVADAAGLLSTLGLGPCRIAGASLGAMIAQELAVVRPDLVRSLALLATRGRTDLFRTAVAHASAEAARSKDTVPARYAAVNTMAQLLSPATLANDRSAGDWLDMLVAFPIEGEGPAAQYEATVAPDRLDALSAVACPALVIAFSDDVLMPPALGREVADTVPGCRYLEFAECGHFGFLERPDDINRAVIDFFGAT